MISQSHIELVVAEIDEKLIGSGYARIELAKPYKKFKNYAYLGFMYVLPEFRGRGINQLIIKALADWSRTQNITELQLEVYDLNHSAVKAYEKAGFTKHLVRMRKPIQN